jgi:hypothetical protein
MDDKIFINEKQALEVLIQAYKQACIAAEVAQRARDTAKEDFLSFVDNKEGQYGDVTVSKIQPEAGFDWKALLEEYAFEKKKIAKFFKEKDVYTRVTVKRSISGVTL